MLETPCGPLSFALPFGVHHLLTLKDFSKSNYSFSACPEIGPSAWKGQERDIIDKQTSLALVP